MYTDIDYVNVGNEIDVFGTLVLEDHLEGTVSQILYLGPGSYFMKFM